MCNNVDIRITDIEDAKKNLIAKKWMRLERWAKRHDIQVVLKKIITLNRIMDGELDWETVIILKDAIDKGYIGKIQKIQKKVKG